MSGTAPASVGAGVAVPRNAPFRLIATPPDRLAQHHVRQKCLTPACPCWLRCHYPGGHEDGKQYTHAVFAADLSLTLPDGTSLDAVNASTDSGVWQSVGRIVSEIPAVLKRQGQRIVQARERIATIDRELVRLSQWDSQATYDAALSELSAINAAFAAAEEEAAAAHALAPRMPVDDVPMAAEPASTALAGGRAPASTEASLAEELLALAHAEQAQAGWELQRTIIPPAPASLAWMAAEVERLATPCPPPLEAMAAAEPEEAGVPVLAGEVGLFRPASPANVQFGTVVAQRRTPRPEVSRPAHSETEVSQLSLF